VGQGIDKGKLKIAWNASDKKPRPQFDYSPLRREAHGQLDDDSRKKKNRPTTGEYTWTMPKDVPFSVFT